MNTTTMNPKLAKFLEISIFLSLLALALGAVTSISVMTLSHVFMVIPILYFLPKADYRNMPKSAWALLGLAVVLVLSIVVNQDIISNGYKFISKTKYFFIAFLSIAPLRWYLNERETKGQVKALFYVLLFATVVSAVSGFFAMKTGSNPLTGGVPWVQVRNSGLMRNVMNYAHNLSFIMVILGWMVLNKKISEKFVNYKVLVICSLINLVAFYVTYTRGAWLGFIVALPFLIVTKFSFKKIALAFGVVLLVLFSAYQFAGDRVLRADGDATRIGLWKSAFYMAKERPVLGFGYQNSEKHTMAIKERYDLEKPNFGGLLHNSHLEILASAAGLGVIFYFGWIAFWVRESFRSQGFKGLELGLVVCFFVGGLTQSTIGLGANLFVILIIYSLAKAWQRKDA